jgi:hypothetical protein
MRSGGDPATLFPPPLAGEGGPERRAGTSRKGQSATRISGIEGIADMAERLCDGR